MITWGARGNPSQQSWQSLGAIATGQVHTFTRYRTASNGASLHPLQRTGQVGSDSHDFQVNHAHWGGRGLGDPLYPAATFVMTLPPVVPLYGNPRDPAFRV